MKSFFVSAILSRNKGEGISSEPNCTFHTCVFLKGTVSKSDSVSYASFCLRDINHCNRCGISSYFCETRFGARSARSAREKCFKLFCCRNIVTISTSFEPYLSSLSFWRRAKMLQEAFWVLLSLRKNGSPLNKRHNRNFFHFASQGETVTSKYHFVLFPWSRPLRASRLGVCLKL